MKFHIGTILLAAAVIGVVLWVIKNDGNGATGLPG